MTIRTKLTILFTAITTTVLLIFAVFIYVSAKKSREEEFYEELKKEAITKAHLYITARVDKHILQDIYHNNRQFLNEVEVAIYNSSFELIYHDAIDLDFVHETPNMLRDILIEKEVRFYQKDWQVIGLNYENGTENLLITAAALDQYGYAKLNYLYRMIVIGCVVAIACMYVLGAWFAKKMFVPITKMSQRATTISATNLHLRLAERKNKDELSALAQSFNQMLNRLEESFEAQKNFVVNVSHELRTPLAAMITEIELLNNRNHGVEHYQNATNAILEDAQKLARLITDILDLAKASYDTSSVHMKTIRIDEVLMEARKQVKKNFPHYLIDLYFEDELEDEAFVSVLGNEYLLEVAFINLFENGCKFSSDHRCKVSVFFDQNAIIVRVLDNGIGISKQEELRIFEPFYRGKNATYADGNGVGLSLVQKIIVLHKGIISLESNSNKETIFRVELPHIHQGNFKKPPEALF